MLFSTRFVVHWWSPWISRNTISRQVSNLIYSILKTVLSESSLSHRVDQCILLGSLTRPCSIPHIQCWPWLTRIGVTSIRLAGWPGCHWGRPCSRSPCLPGSGRMLPQPHVLETSKPDCWFKQLHNLIGRKKAHAQPSSVCHATMPTL